MSLEALGMVSSWPEMKPNLRGIAYEIANCHNPETRQCNPSMEYLSKRCLVTDRSIKMIISELEGIGVLKRIPTFKGGRQCSNQYQFFSYRGETDFPPEGETDFPQKQKERNRKNETVKDPGVKKPENASYDEKHKGKTRFRNPTIEEVRESISRQKLSVDSEEFYDHHEARGWILSNGKAMKKLDPTIRTWVRNGKKWSSKKEKATSHNGYQTL